MPRKTGLLGTAYVTENRKKLVKEEESILNIQRPLVTRLVRDTVDKENETPKNR